MQPALAGLSTRRLENKARANADALLAKFLRPEHWRLVRNRVVAFYRAIGQKAIVDEARRNNLRALLGRLDPRLPSKTRALMRQFPLGAGAHGLVTALLDRRCAYYRRRGRSIPKNWPVPLHDDLAAIYDAINLVDEYTHGAAAIEMFDEEMERLQFAEHRIAIAFQQSNAGIEYLIERIETRDRFPLQAYWARAMLAAGLTASVGWPTRERRKTNKTDVVRIAETLERVTPKIPRKVVAAWVREIGLADVTERSWTTLLHRLRRAGHASVSLRKKHRTKTK